MNADEAAYKSWPILIETAVAKTTITYSDLAARIGTGRRSLSRPLGYVQSVCMSAGMPPLSILAVLKNRRVPSSGFIAWDLDDAASGMKAVYSYTWNDANPFDYAKDGDNVDKLAKELVRNPDKAELIYRRVTARGTAQTIFHRAILQAYDNRCAICGTTITQCLEAAHLIPWSDASPEQRISPANGVCLCAFHHRLFDTGLITVDASGTVRYCEKANAGYNKSDKMMSTDLDGKRAHLPTRDELRPSVEALNYHYQLRRWNQSPWFLRAD